MLPIEAKLVIDAEMTAKNPSEGRWPEGYFQEEYQQFPRTRRPTRLSQNLGKVLVWAGNKLLRYSQRDEVCMTS